MRAYLIGRRLFAAIQRFKDALHIDRPATLFTHKCPRAGQPHRFATFWAGYKLIGADRGDADSLGVTPPQPRTQLSQRPHLAIAPLVNGRTDEKRRRPVDAIDFDSAKSLPEPERSECDIQHKIAFSKYI
ncbi:MAG TPA: hypothetical protein VF778_07155 [Xanthobacteraceae bacterium]